MLMEVAVGCPEMSESVGPQSIEGRERERERERA